MGCDELSDIDMSVVLGAGQLAALQARLAARIDALLAAPHETAFAQLHELEVAVLALLAQHRPEGGSIERRAVRWS